MGLTGVNLGAAYAQVLVDYSQMERDANQAFQRIEQGLTDKLNNMGQKMMLVGRNLDLLLSPVQSFVQQGVFAFANFDEVMTEIAARTGATADEMDILRKTAIKMGQETAFSATEAGEAMVQLLSSGSTLEETLAALPAVLNLAAAGGIGLGEAADGVTDILAEFQLEVNKLSPRLAGIAELYGLNEEKLESWTDSLTDAENPLAQFAENIDLTVGEAIDALQNFEDAPPQMVENFQRVADELGLSLSDLLAMSEDITAADSPFTQFATDIDLTTGELVDFISGIEDSTSVVNSLAAASQSSSATLADMIAAFQNGGAVAHTYGLTVDETAAVLAVFAESGLKGSEAGNQLRSMLNNMTRPVDEVQKMWNDLGVTMTDSEGNFRNIDDIIKDLNVSLEGMSESERAEAVKTLAGSFGQLGLEALLSADGISTMQDQMESGASAADVARIQLESFNAKTNQLKSSLETFSISVLGPLVEDYLKPLIVSVTDILNEMTAWAEKNPELAGQIGVLLGVLSVLGPVITGIGVAIILLASPIGLMSLTILGIVAALGALWIAYKQNFMGFADGVNDAFEEIQPTLEAVVSWFEALVDAFQSGGLQGALDFVVGEFERLQNTLSSIDWRGLAGQGAGLLGGLWEMFKPRASEAIDMARTWVNEHIIQPVVDYVSNIDWMALGNQSIDFLGSLLEWLGNQAMAGGNIAVNWLNAHVLQPIVDYVSNIDWGALAGQGIDFIGGLLAWLGGQASAGGEAAAGQASSAGNKAADWVQSNIIQPVIDYINNIDWSSLANQGIDFVGGLLDWLGAQAVAGGNIAIDWAKEHIIQPILDALNITPEDIEGAGNFLSALFDSIAAGVVDAAAWIDTNIITRITDAMPDVDLGTMGDFLIAIFGAIGDCAMDVAAWIKDFIVTPLNEQLNEVDWDEIGCFIGDIFDAIAAEAPDIAQWILDNIINPLGDALATADWSQIADDLGTFFSNLWAEIKENAPKVADWVWENIGVPVKDAVADIDWSQVADDLAGFGKDLYAALGEAVDFASEAASWVNDNILSPIGNAISDAGDFLGIGGDGGDGEQPAWVQSLQDGFGEGEDAAPLALATEEQIDELNDLKTWFEENSGKVIEKLDAMKAAAQFMIETLTELTIGGVDKLNIWRDGFTDILPGIIAFRDGFTETLLSAIEPVNLLSDAVRILSQRLYDLSLHNTITVSVSGSVDVPTPARAEGGRIDANVMFLGAEQQRGELFVSDRSGMVVNNDQLQTAINALSQGGGGRTVNVYIDGDTIKDEAAARRNGDIFGQQILEVLRST